MEYHLLASSVLPPEWECNAALKGRWQIRTPFSTGFTSTSQPHESSAPFEQPRPAPGENRKHHPLLSTNPCFQGDPLLSPLFSQTHPLHQPLNTPLPSLPSPTSSHGTLPSNNHPKPIEPKQRNNAQRDRHRLAQPDGARHRRPGQHERRQQAQLRPVRLVRADAHAREGVLDDVSLLGLGKKRRVRVKGVSRRESEVEDAWIWEY